MKLITVLLFLFTLTFSSMTQAAPADDDHGAMYGISAFGVLISKDPTPMHIYRGSFWYQPASWRWTHFRIYLDAGISHMWIAESRENHVVNAYFISPIIRYDFLPGHSISPFIRLGIGATWLSRTRFDSRNLGMHYVFQDKIGVGVSFGRRQDFSVILSTLHYSNASLANMNAGITVPLLLGVEWRIN